MLSAPYYTPELTTFLADAQLSPDEKVAQNMQTIQNLQPLARAAGSYACLLSGGYAAVSAPPEGQGQIDTRAVLEDAGVYERYLIERKDGRTLRNTAGFNTLVRRHRALQDAYAFDKFYLSLDLSNPEQLAKGTQLFADITAAATEQEILFSTKDFTHAYDALLLYLHRPDTPKVARILQDLYPRYLADGLFYDTQHFFQAPLNGISPLHVGFVQEPMYGLERSKKIGSHSQRLGRLGAHLDTIGPAKGSALTPGEFATAAALGQVDPAYPYLLATYL